MQTALSVVHRAVVIAPVISRTPHGPPSSIVHWPSGDEVLNGSQLAAPAFLKNSLQVTWTVDGGPSLVPSKLVSSVHQLTVFASVHATDAGPGVHGAASAEPAGASMVGAGASIVAPVPPDSPLWQAAVQMTTRQAKARIS